MRDFRTFPGYTWFYHRYYQPKNLPDYKAEIEQKYFYIQLDLVHRTDIFRGYTEAGQEAAQWNIDIIKLAKSAELLEFQRIRFISKTKLVCLCRTILIPLTSTVTILSSKIYELFTK